MERKIIDLRIARDFGQTVNVTFEFLRHNFKPLGKAILYIPGPFMLLSGVFSGLYQTTAFTFGMQPVNIFEMTSEFLLSAIFILISMILLTALVYNYMIMYSESPETEIQVEQLWRRSKKDILKVTGFIILLSLILLLIFTPLFIVVFSGNVFITVMIFLLLLIPLVYVANSASLIFIAGIAERKGFIDSLKRSFELIKNKWWITLGLVIVFSLIQGFISFIFQLPQTVAAVIIGFSSIDGSQPGFLAEIFLIIVSILSSFSYLLYVISLAGLSFHYHSLIEQKEAKSLFQKIENL